MGHKQKEKKTPAERTSRDAASIQLNMTALQQTSLPNTAM